jgi:hypothetical protein
MLKITALDFYFIFYKLYQYKAGEPYRYREGSKLSFDIENPLVTQRYLAKFEPSLCCRHTVMQAYSSHNLFILPLSIGLS